MELFIIYKDTKSTFKLSSLSGEEAQLLINFKCLTAKTEQGSELKTPEDEAN